ncbi:MAG: hypothetical protein PHF86_09015 [Candidatus Nanoarchaeia archaeon]|nr:hypothetical protein [Candidatus Nanoarchaeia archaeon]
MKEDELKKELELFLQDLESDGVDLGNLPCNIREHKKEHCDICKFFEACPFPNNIELED